MVALQPHLVDDIKLLGVIISRTATVDDPLLYSAGASCAPDAKLNNAESDDFEIGWSDAYGIVEGDGEYTIHDIEC